MKTQKMETGDRGEELAEMFLMKQGYKIIARNYWKPWGEIDIVAKKGEWIHFVEVKTVIRDLASIKDNEDYSPFDNITADKKRRLCSALKTFLAENSYSADADWQVDAIAVYLDKVSKKYDIDFLEDVDL